MTKKTIPAYKGRMLGIVALTVAQVLIGTIHVFSGLSLLVFEKLSGIQATIAYDIYTLVFGILVLVFASYLWQRKKAGWFGTIAVSLLVITVDSLALLNLPTIPGVPKVPAVAEITYSVLIIGYLCTNHVRKKYLDSS
jgi:heme A synthase